ncbi:MAG: NADH-quinone oxidoreductase subunit A [Gemmataceae bacterium]
MTPLAAYVLLFLAVGVGFVLVHLVAGKLVRPSRANPEKGTVYECAGSRPSARRGCSSTCGSTWWRLFVIFDVEVAFFFPWAEVFGKASAVRAAADPVTLAEHAAAAAAVNDLGTPPGSISGKPLAAERSAPPGSGRWRKLAGMGREEFEAHAQLKGDLTRAARPAGRAGARRRPLPLRAPARRTQGPGLPPRRRLHQPQGPAPGRLQGDPGGHGEAVRGPAEGHRTGGAGERRPGPPAPCPA